MRGHALELTDYLTILRKRWVGIAMITLAVLAVAAIVTLITTPLYSATARMFFSVQTGDSISDLNQGSNFAERQMSSYAEVATSPLVLEPVVDELGLSDTPQALANSLMVSVPSNTVTLSIEATHEDPVIAADIANAVAAQLAVTVGDLSPAQADGTEAVRATILTPATSPSQPSSPNIPVNLALGVLVGLALGVGFAVLREVTDTKIRGERDIAQLTDTAVIGHVVFDKATPTHPVYMEHDPSGTLAEAIRRLRTNLQFVDLAGKPKSIVMTSSVAGEGKSTTAINLAVALAQAGSRVVLIDADLRRPSVAEYLGLEGSVGLTTVLIGRAEIEDVIQPYRDLPLEILTSGQLPPNPSELLGSRAMAALLEQLTQSHDYVILDCPPLLPVTDAAVLSKLAGGALVVAGADRIHKAQLTEALGNLEQVEARVLGIVLNKVERTDPSGYYYTYESYRTTEQVQERERDREQERRSPSRQPTPRRHANNAGAQGNTWPGRPLSAARSRR